MAVSLVKLILFLFVLMGDVQQYESVTFNRKRTGVKFLPYIGPDGIDITLRALATTPENVKAMLEVVSTKFSRVFVDSTDAQDEPYRKNFTYRHQTIARASTPEMAALINRERNELVLTIMLGISLTWGEKQQSETEVRVALEAYEIAESIYPGTVEGFLLSNYELDSLEWAEETFKWMIFLKSYLGARSIPIGTEQGCGGNLLNFEGQNKSNPNSVKIGFLRKEIVLKSDFLICFSSPGEYLAALQARIAFQIISSVALKKWNSLKLINENLEFMWSTFWPKADGKETQSDYDNLGFYWASADNFATAHNLTVWLDGAFSGAAGQQLKVSWWKLTQFDQKNDVSAYVEQVDLQTNSTVNDTNHSVDNSSFTERTTTSLDTANSESFAKSSNTSESISKAFGKYDKVIVGIMVFVGLSILVYLVYRRWNLSRSIILSRHEIDYFKFGSNITSNANFQDNFENLINRVALKLPFDLSIEMPKTKLKFCK